MTKLATDNGALTKCEDPNSDQPRAVRAIYGDNADPAAWFHAIGVYPGDR